LQVGEQLFVDVVDQVVAGEGVVVVEAAVGFLGGSPDGPAVLGINDVGVLLAFEFGFLFAVFF
jgi:hypothetical protein